MRTTVLREVTIAVVGGAVLLGSLWASVGVATSSSAHPGGARPSCLASTDLIATTRQFPPPPASYNVAFKVRCNFNVTRLSFRTSKAIVRVRRHPSLQRPDLGDRLRCRRYSSTLGICDGDVGANARIKGAFKTQADPCRPEPLQTRFRASGGVDADGRPAPDIAYEVVVSVPRPRSCLP